MVDNEWVKVKYYCIFYYGAETIHERVKAVFAKTQTNQQNKFNNN
jgi:hypothetical protein